MKENSIEEDIILLKDFTEGNFKRDKLENYKGSYKMGYFYYKDIQQAIEHVLENYKRVLKENEELILDNLEYQRIQDIFDKRTYRKKYLEERRKEEPNLLYPDVDEIYRRYYELRKENEELKNNKSIVEKILDKGKGFTLRQTQYIWEHYIPIQKVKDKIEELDKKVKDYQCVENRINLYQRKVLQELLEGRKI